VGLVWQSLLAPSTFSEHAPLLALGLVSRNVLSCTRRVLNAHRHCQDVYEIVISSLCRHL